MCLLSRIKKFIPDAVNTRSPVHAPLRLEALLPPEYLKGVRAYRRWISRKLDHLFIDKCRPGVCRV